MCDGYPTQDDGRLPLRFNVYWGREVDERDMQQGRRVQSQIPQMILTDIDTSATKFGSSLDESYFGSVRCGATLSNETLATI